MLTVPSAVRQLTMHLPLILALLAAEPRPGHSPHGEAFDSGPRTRPLLMPFIGTTHFPITHKNPEVQRWFDQGNTLLHSFWDYEAERSFRWCLKLEPENAMCFWGLARATGEERSKAFLREAVKRKASVTERERLYIEALEARERIDRLRDRGDGFRDRERDYKKILETICLKFPADNEARLLLALANMGDSRYGTETILREVEARQPDHPGLHHYRIHNWNYHEPEQALASSRRYAAIAPNVGHALHMPGHIYATVGMWKEAAIAMDSATRTEVRHMHERQVFPFNYWNWGHNRAYLSYIQEQLGLPELAIAGARDLIEAPQDPASNGAAPFSPHSQGIRSLTRVLVKYERWKDLLDSRTIPWRDIPNDRILKAYAETRAHLGLGNLDEAEKSFNALQKFKDDKSVTGLYSIMSVELRARLALAKGETLLGLGLLTEAAEKQFEFQQSDNDPPHYPQVLYNSLGEAYLAADSKDLAIRSFEKALTLTRNDRFALDGLRRAGKPRTFTTPEPERDYPSSPLDKFGPARWSPFDAPALNALDTEGKPVMLSSYAGHNVILVFYLGRECPHCLKQLRDLNAKSASFRDRNTQILAISPNTPTQNQSLLGNTAYQGIRFLSDSNHENARRFLAWDDFEDMELHATILIDKTGKLRWSRVGGEPFEDLKFLEQLVDQLQKENLPNL
ncbi:MAG: redoxin domain-containing protein [Acidobacteriota bacterium]